MRYLNVLIMIRIVKSKNKKIKIKIWDLNKRKMIYVSMDGWGICDNCIEFG